MSTNAGFRQRHLIASLILVLSFTAVSCASSPSDAQPEKATSTSVANSTTATVSSAPTVTETVETTTTTTTPAVTQPDFASSRKTPVWAVSLIADQSGVFVTSEQPGEGDEWCPDATVLWEWRHEAEPELAFVVPGSRVLFGQPLEDGRLALVAQCERQAYAMHIVDGGVITETIEIAPEDARLLSRNSMETEGSVRFGGVEINLSTFGVSMSASNVRNVPGAEGLQIVSEEVEGLGCEVSGIDDAIWVRNEDGSGTELMRGSGYGFEVVWGQDGQFLLRFATCIEGWSSLAVGSIDLETGDVKSFDTLCFIPELHETELSSYGFSVATFTADELRMWRNGWENVAYVSLDLDALPIESTTTPEDCKAP